MTDAASILNAPRYGLLLGQVACHFCQATTRTAVLWVASYEERVGEGVVDEGGPAVLHCVEWLDSDVEAFLCLYAPWVRLAPTATSRLTYHANHCETCGAIQGDHYLHGPDGPYFPQTDADLARLRFVDGAGWLMAVASAGQSGWMERVEDVCARG